MCEPTILASVAAQVAGTVIQDRANKKARRARNTAIDNNSKRRKVLEDQARMATSKSKDMFQDDAFDAGNQVSQSKFAKLYNDTINTPNYSMPNVGSAPAIIQEALDSEMAKAAAYNRQQGEAKAKLASLGDYLATQVNPQLSKSANTGQMIGNFLQGEGNVLDAELRAAEAKAYSPMAQLLGSAGQVGTSYGLSKKSKV